MKTIFNKIVILCTCLFVFIAFVSFNQSEVMTENVFEGEFVRIVFKADTTYVPNDFRSITTKQIRSDNLRAVFQEFGVEKFTPVFKNRYNTDGQLKKDFKGKEKDSWFIVSAMLRSPKSFVDKLNSVTGIVNAYIEESVVVPCDTTYAFSFGIDQWFLNRNQGINVQDAWTINRGRSDVIIAVCDGGVDYTHPNLDPGNRSRVIVGYDTGSNDNDPMDDLPDVPNSFANHGTHIAGIIGTNPTSTHHISGVMQNCKIMPVKVVGSGGIKYPFRDVYVWDFSSTAFPSDIADGIDYAVNHGAHVINLSIGFWFPNIPLTDVISGLNVLISAINNAYNNNVLVIASMGNEGNNGSPYQFPAKLPHVLAVGATDQSQQKANFSSVGSHISVCAPGVSILSTVRNGGTITKNGTSMATPVVCGVAGLIISQGKDRGFNLTNDDVRQILERTADDVGTPGFDNETGHGIVNAYSALQLLSSPNNLIHGISYGGSFNKINTLNQWVLSSPCYSLAAGVYLNVDQYQITKHITFDTPFLSPPVVWLRERESLSLSFANPNDGRSYVEITNITNTGFDVRYAAYYVRYNSIGQTINKWIPENLSSTKITYTTVGVPAPQISGPSAVCNQATFTINNLPQGAMVNWTLMGSLSMVQNNGSSIVVAATGSSTNSRVYATISVGSNQINLMKGVTTRINISISGPNVVNCNNTGTWTSSIAGCPPVEDITYKWTFENQTNGQFFNMYGQTASIRPSCTNMIMYKSNSSQVDEAIRIPPGLPSNTYNITLKATTESDVSYYAYKNNVVVNGYMNWLLPDAAGSDNLIHIYPNPANGIVTIALTEDVNKTTSQTTGKSASYTIQLWNSFGLVKSTETDLTEYQLSLHGIPAGFYYVNVIKDGHVYRKQLTVK